MSMNTNLPGRLRNTSLPLGRSLFPLFEAVVNSIHAIEEAGLAATDGRIKVEILRSGQGLLGFDDGKKKPGPPPTRDIQGFRITDNGIGFNDANMESFETLDSEHKAEQGGRGVGRLSWLKAFARVNVESIYATEGGQANKGESTRTKRTFVFSSDRGVSEPTVESVSSDSECITSVHLDGFKKKYREASLKTGGPIANSLLEHCLWYFVRKGSAPKITILDGDEIIEVDGVYESHMHSSAKSDSFSIKGARFEATHIKLHASSARPHIIALCAANRLVTEEHINGKVPGLHGRLRDDDGEFVYACYVSSPFLDNAVRPERTGFDIAERAEDLFSDSDIGLAEILDAAIGRAAKHLASYLEENKRRGRERVENFVSTKAPRYRPILSRIPEDRLSVDPAISDRDLDLTLHRQLSEIESTLLSEGHDLMKPMADEELPEYETRLQEYLHTVADIKKSDLANYVSHRKVVLDLLAQAIRRDEEGKYAREDLIHKLIMPMRVESGEVMFDRCNLWLVDERLAFHDYLGSDKTLLSMPITGSEETKEPDLCALNVLNNPVLVSEGKEPPLASLVIVEIKRPMRNDAQQGEDKDPIEQALGYLDKIRKGGVQTASGRPIPRSESVPGFCYTICDITPTVESRCRIHGLTATSDNLGYFGYNSNYNAYIEVTSFDQLVKAAKERNRAFFDKLGLPTT